mmetsp:Transcript_6805/g.17379  ORF Transcript_6805/g.17379 Transcript_6805/m.17379 type:complete len:109 (-) Transcript_6805:34-360(-)
MTTPMVIGFTVAAAAMAGGGIIISAQKMFASPRSRKFYEGGFMPKMTRREAALILGIRESSKEDRVKAAHKTLMVANHPDSGGSDFVAAKVNEAKDILLGKKKDESIF